MSPPLRLALVTDIHHGKTSFTKKGPEALGLLEEFVAFANRERPDYVVDLGDRITDIDPATDRALTADVAAVFAGLTSPRHHILGNHDLAFMSESDNAELLGHAMGHHSVDVQGYHLVFWQMDTRLSLEGGFTPRQADLDWLRADLADTTLPAVIFSHVPLDGGSMRGNYWFQNNARFGGLPHTDEIQETIQGAGNVVLCVAGHVHWNNVNIIDGIPHLSLQSLSESYTTEGEATGAWAWIELDEEIRWRTHGRDPIQLAVPKRSHNAHWIEPLPPFEVLRSRRLATRGLDGVRGLLLDMDGVLYRGHEPVPGAAEAMRRLRDAGLDLMAVTNNARARAGDYADKLAGLGIELPAARIVTSGEATARHLAGLTPGAGVFVAGSAALREELLAAGLTESDHPDYVVAGIDLAMPLSRLAEATRHLLRGARLVASNPDRLLPVADGFEPECGPVVAFLEAASGQTALVAGKPHRPIFDLALDRLGLPRDTVVMVGDTVDTDIAGAVGSGLRSALVASGNSAPATAFEPTVRVADLAELARLLLD